MGLHSTRNMQSNMTWALPVDLGFNYLVRLHFCEIDRNINYIGERRFLIYIDYQLAEENADVLLWTDEREMPNLQRLRSNDPNEGTWWGEAVYSLN